MSSIPFLKRIFLKKPISLNEEEENHLARTLSLFDLICVGVGGTIGTGVFVLCGLIASEDAGAATPLSYLIAGFACLFSAASYGELSSRMPSAGSSYAYTYSTLGEFPAVVAAWMISLEYGINASAISRSWGDKMNYVLLKFGSNIGFTMSSYGVSVFGGLLLVLCTFLLLLGAETGKTTINIFTTLKVLLVIFMIVGGFCFFKVDNFTQFIPYGVSGVFKGATSCFFAFIGRYGIHYSTYTYYICCTDTNYILLCSRVYVRL